MISIIVAIAFAGGLTPPPDAPEMAPTPYTAEQIRKASQEGRTWRFDVVEDGKRLVRTMELAQVSDAGTDVVVRTYSPAGDPVGEARTSKPTWEELRQHASFPVASVTIADTAVDVPAGRFDATLYTVRAVVDGVPAVSELWFAKDQPGAPVKTVITSGGRVSFAMELAAHVGGCPLEQIRFDYDRSDVRAEEAKKLARMADCISARWRPVVVEAHTDGHGRTEEYALALASRMAQGVKRLLIKHGVPARLVSTVSYGEDKPLCREATEECRARNRRAEIHFR